MLLQSIIINSIREFLKANDNYQMDSKSNQPLNSQLHNTQPNLFVFNQMGEIIIICLSCHNFFFKADHF